MIFGSQNQITAKLVEKKSCQQKFLTKASVLVILGLLKLSMVILDNPTKNCEFGGSSNVAMFFVYVNFDNAKMYQKFMLQSFLLLLMIVEALHYYYGEYGPCNHFFCLKII